MHSLDNASTIVGFLETTNDPVLKNLLADRVHDWTATDLLDLTHLLIVETGDTEEAVTDAIGSSPLVNPVDGLRYGDEDYQFPWDWVEEHADWLELMMTIGNDGHALFLLVERGAGLPSELRTMSRAHAGR